MPRKHATITLKSHEYLMEKLKKELNQRLTESHAAMLDKIAELRNENTRLKQRGVGADIYQACYGFAKGGPAKTNKKLVDFVKLHKR